MIGCGDKGEVDYRGVGIWKGVKVKEEQRERRVTGCWKKITWYLRIHLLLLLLSISKSP